MNYNLALLPADEKEQIELEKQAAYLVWQVKNNLIDKNAFQIKLNTIKDDEKRQFFNLNIEKYLEK